MDRQVTLVIPEAPPRTSGDLAPRRRIARSGVRLGVLNNNKGNADHLLRFLVDGIKAAVAVSTVVALRKEVAGLAAVDQILDQLASESDFVVTAMAD